MQWPSKTELRILALLVTHGEMTGLDTVRASEGRLARGGIYTLLGRLADKGLVESRTENPPPGAGGKPRRLYRVSGHGQRVIHAAELAHGGKLVWR